LQHPIKVDLVIMDTNSFTYSVQVGSQGGNPQTFRASAQAWCDRHVFGFITPSK
jgi:hypothetical protein